MLLQNSTNLENLVVKLLTEAKVGLSALEILERVGKSWKAYSRRGIYKELERLEREGVVLRSSGRYTLRLAWLLSLHNELEEMLKVARNPGLLKNFLPTKGQEINVQCSDLVRWDRIWTQLMLSMHAVFPALPMFIWNPRHWFNLTHPEINSTFARANETSKNLRYVIVGGRGWLDLRDRKHLARNSTGFSHRVSPFEYDRTHYYWIIGDYVGISTLNAKTAASIENIYQSTKKSSDFDSSLVKKLLSQKCSGSVRCSWAPEKAERLRVKFTNHFGLKLAENGEIPKIRYGEL